MPSLLRQFVALALPCLASVMAPAAHAGLVTVAVSDAAGRPLPDAVVLLEPAAGKATVKPMTGVEISQAKRQFQPRVTVVTVGSRVNFPNFDTVRHHVYSFSKARTFEIKLYAGVPAEPVLFDKPGIAVLGCNIHDRMAAWVVVADTPWNALAAADGIARIADAPPGGYTLSVWHPALATGSAPLTRAVQVGTAELREAFQLDVAAQP